MVFYCRGVNPNPLKGYHLFLSKLFQAELQVKEALAHGSFLTPRGGSDQDRFQFERLGYFAPWRSGGALSSNEGGRWGDHCLYV